MGTTPLSTPRRATSTLDPSKVAIPRESLGNIMKWLDRSARRHGGDRDIRLALQVLRSYSDAVPPPSS